MPKINGQEEMTILLYVETAYGQKTRKRSKVQRRHQQEDDRPRFAYNNCIASIKIREIEARKGR